MNETALNKMIMLDSVCVQLGGVDILKRVSFNVKPGEIVGLIGANGAGKSTAVRAALGLLKLQVGAVIVDGVNADEIAIKEKAKYLSYVPQGTPVHWPLVAERLVALGRTPHLGPWDSISDEDQRIIDNAMQETGIQHLKGRIATTLSGGEIARLMLARTIAVKAPYMLADEPTAALDPFHRLQVMDIMKRLAQNGTGILIVLHDLNFAQNYCDRLVLLHEGMVLAQGTPADVLSDENLMQAFQIRVSRWNDGQSAYLLPSSGVDEIGGNSAGLSS